MYLLEAEVVLLRMELLPYEGQGNMMLEGPEGPEGESALELLQREAAVAMCKASRSAGFLRVRQAVSYRYDYRCSKGTSHLLRQSR
jgi:hypothetical protein